MPVTVRKDIDVFSSYSIKEKFVMGNFLEAAWLYFQIMKAKEESKNGKLFGTGESTVLVQKV